MLWPRGRRAQQPGRLDLQQDVSGEWAIISISGELDIATAGRVRRAVAPEALPEGRTHLALDLADLTFCDSTGIGVLIGAYNRLSDVGGRLILLHTPEHLARLLRTASLDRVLPTYDSLDAA